MSGTLLNRISRVSPQRAKQPARWARATLVLAVAACLLCACASGPRVPDWQLNAKGDSDRFVAAYLDGNTRVETLEFARLRSALSATGRLELLARAELLRCALSTASVALQGCAGFEAVQADAAEPEQAYARYLAGRGLPSDLALLPEQHRGIAAGQSSVDALKAMGDPLSQLVAAGVLLQAGRASPAVAAWATDIASTQGWRRPLLAWLNVQASLADKSGDTAQAERLRRRIAFVLAP
jgi:hypothetical protein